MSRSAGSSPLRKTSTSTIPTTIQARSPRVRCRRSSRRLASRYRIQKASRYNAAMPRAVITVMSSLPRSEVTLPASLAS